MRKRIACLHDLSSFGGAGLMNIIPIMYSLGIEVCPIPTSLFTSHGSLKASQSMDVSGFMKEYTKQYKKLELHFDGIYLGLFTSLAQMIEAKKFLDVFSEKDTLILLDPIMGDNGKLYGFMNKNNIKIIREIIKRVQIITPNFTEACILLDKEYNEDFTENEIKQLLVSLSNLGPEYVIITSVPRQNYLCTYIYSRMEKRIDMVKSEKRPGSYPGTGDAFTATLMAHLLNGSSLIDSVSKAANLVEKGIDIILKNGYNHLEGLPLAEYLLK